MHAFMRDRVLPAEGEYLAHRRAAGPDGHVLPPVVEKLKEQARAEGLWNLFLPAESGLTQLEYAPIAELSGWSLDIAPEAINGSAPDTGNMDCCTCWAPMRRKSNGSRRCWRARSGPASR